MYLRHLLTFNPLLLVAKLTRCCLDSGFESFGNKSCINPSNVEKLGLQPYRIDRKIGLADGSTSHLRWEVEARLSFQIPSGLLTIPVVFEVRPKDSPSDSMILSTGVLHSLGGIHDHRTNPSTFQVTDLTSGELVPLQREDPHVKLELSWYPKKEDPIGYIFEIIHSPAFLKRGQREGLPAVAMRDVCSSRDLTDLEMQMELRLTVFLSGTGFGTDRGSVAAKFWVKNSIHSAQDSSQN